MLLLSSSDSGYNSPCTGTEPSPSFASPCFSSIGLKAKRKLCFGLSTPFTASSRDGKNECDFNISQEKGRRSEEIARRLIHYCDVFDDEFNKVSAERQECIWIRTTYNYFCSWL
ncbi:unnamed protein product [Haemonchus placei]|uniref:Uncharacterized protein n=1 Tax=Haemonchus placei TaxID=6290 RepID=A0A0N4X462_HAEPC|nr:unnamed protein product [Haemonchus placei]